MLRERDRPIPSCKGASLGLAALLAAATSCAPSAPQDAPPRSASSATASGSATATASASASPSTDPSTQAIAKFRAWAQGSDLELKRQGLTELAWARDSEGVDLAMRALGGKGPSARAAAAAALGYYGAAAAEKAIPALQQALATADDADKPSLIWALVELGDRSVFAQALALYRADRFRGVVGIDGRAAFDLESLSKLCPADDLARLAEDPAPAARLLATVGLARASHATRTSLLVKLARDADDEVAAEALCGLAQTPDEVARAALLSGLSTGSKDRRQHALAALRDRVGGAALVIALEAISASAPPEQAWFEHRQIFGMLHELADPRAADALVRWVEQKKPAMHWKGEAALCLAEVGDVRAVKLLTERLGADPEKLYDRASFWQADQGGHLSRHDQPRVAAVRLLVDLARMHPDRRAEIRAAEDAVLAWMKARPAPHANGLRFLAAVGSDKGLGPIRRWAFPDEPLPKEGAQPPFPIAFEIAQPALRAIGMLRDEPSFTRLVAQLQRKSGGNSKTLDISNEGLLGAGVAILGMVLRGLAYGAAEGLGEWGDPRAAAPLVELIEDRLHHEEARLAACQALAWCQDGAAATALVQKAAALASKGTTASTFTAFCYATTLGARRVPGAVPAMVDVLQTHPDLDFRMRVAVALGRSGVDGAEATKLAQLLDAPATRTPAALALLLGGPPDAAPRAAESLERAGGPDREALRDAYFRASAVWTHEDVEDGSLYRRIENAEAVARVRVDDVQIGWARERLTKQLENVAFDNGPHSITRPMLRVLLHRAARSPDAREASRAILALRYVNERGMLLALRADPQVGELARRALHELNHPL